MLYFWRLGLTPLDDFDEAYYAAGAREMLARGDLGIPYFNGQPFLLKPILVYWLIAAAFRFLGESELAARLPFASLALLVVLLTYWFGARTQGRRAGLLAGFALGLSYMWVDLGREAMTDMPLVGALTAAVFLFYLAARAPEPVSGRLYLACYPLLGVAALAKGVVPIAVVAAGVLAWLAAARRLRAGLREARLLPGLALFAAVAAPWFVYAALREPEFVRTFFLHEHLGHLHGSLARNEPWWGHLKNLLVYFYPWVAFLPAALGHAFRRDERLGALRFAAWWAIAVVVVLSLARAKLPHYLAIGFPPLALLVGAWLDRWLAGSDGGRPAAVGLALLALVGAVFAGAAVGGPLLLAAGRLPGASQWPTGWTPGWGPVIMLAALAAGSLTAAVGARLRKGVVVPALALSMFAAGLAHVGWFRPRIAQMQAQPRKELAMIAASALPPEEPLGVYYAKRKATVFYARRPIVDLGEWDDQELISFLSSPTPASALTHARFVPVAEEALGGVAVRARRGDYVLLSNQPR